MARRGILNLIKQRLAAIKAERAEERAGRPKVPKFATEAEEAQWWYDNREMVDREMIKAMKNGTVGRNFKERIQERIAEARLKELLATVPAFKTEAEEAAFWDANEDLICEMLKLNGKVVGPLNIQKTASK